MKSLYFFLALFLFSLSSQAQTSYWSSYTLDVKPDMAESVIDALKTFFETETGKTMPAVSVHATMFKPAGMKGTHTVIFGSSDKSHFSSLYSGKYNQDTDWQLLGEKINSGAKGVGSILGKTLVPNNAPGNFVATVYRMAVSDPATYAEAFVQLRADITEMYGGKMGMHLHQVLSGSSDGVTHVAVINAPTFEDMLTFNDEVWGSEAFANFNAKVKDIRKVVTTHTNFIIAQYNTGE
jgi:hypothetical protein